LNILNVIGKNVLSNPCGIAAATYYVDPSKNWIYVSDSYRSLLKIDTTVSGGNIVLNKSLYTDYALDLPGNAIFGAMDCDVFGNLYVVDPVNNQLYKFNPDLQFIESFSGSPGMTFS